MSDIALIFAYLKDKMGFLSAVHNLQPTGQHLASG